MSSYFTSLQTVALGQEGMEIPCTVFFCRPSTVKYAELAERYLQLVKERYSKPANEMILSSFITEAFPKPSTSRTEGQPNVCNGAKKKQKDSQPNRDIREILQAAAQTQLKKITDAINLD